MSSSPLESRIPIPTDQIYKFYALFGLVLIVFSIAAIIYLNKTTNEIIFSSVVERLRLEASTEPEQVREALTKIAEKRHEMAVSNRDIGNKLLGGLIGIAICLCWRGFWRWESIQPIIDETSKTNLEIAKLELKRLRKELGELEPPLQGCEK